MISTNLWNKIEKKSKRDLKNYPQSNKEQWPRWQKHGHRLGIKIGSDHTKRNQFINKKKYAPERV